MRNNQVLHGLLGILLLLSGAFPTVVGAEEPATGSSSKDMEEIIRQYILDHPEVIMESLENFQAQQQAVERKRAKEDSDQRT